MLSPPPTAASGDPQALPPTTDSREPQTVDQSRNSYHEDSHEYAASKVLFEERIKEELDINFIRLKVSPQNYKKKYHNLICWEEKTHIEILDKK